MRLNYITKLSVVVLVFLIFGTLSVFPGSAWGSSRIVNISLKKEGDFTKVAIYGDKPFEFSHFTEKAKGGKPYRVIIDCRDAIFDLPQHNYREGLPPGIISALRTSQFQAVPEKIVRVVLDLKGPVVYRVTDKESENEANIAIVTTQDPDFPMWVAVLDKQKDQKASMEKRQEASIESAHKQGQRSEGSRAAVSAAQSPPKPKPSEKEEGKTVEKGRIYRRAVCYADTGETITAEPVLFYQKKSDEEAAKTEEVEKIPARKDDLSTSTKSTFKPETRARVKEKKTQAVSLSGSEQSPPERSSSRRRISRSRGSVGPFPKSGYSKAEATEETKVTQAETQEKEVVSSEGLGSIKEGIGKILGPEPVSARETEVLAESSMMIQSPQGAQLSLIPQRKMISYNPGTGRDPFQPITERGEMNFGVVPLPLFENLKLVGILKDEEGNRALLEDRMGFGYIMMTGDRIKNGYVVSVEDDKAYFHVEEYGGYQIMVLELNQEY